MKTFKLLFMVLMIVLGLRQCRQVCPCDDPEYIITVKELILANLPDSFFLLADTGEVKEFLDKRIEIYNPTTEKCNFKIKMPAMQCSVKLIYNPIKLAEKDLSPEEMKMFKELGETDSDQIWYFNLRYNIEPYNDQYIIEIENIEQATEWLMSIYVMDISLKTIIKEIKENELQEKN